MKSYENIGRDTLLVTDGKLKYIQLNCFNQYGDELIHCITTREGGVSTGDCGTLNFGFNRGDRRENIKENFKILCRSIGADPESLVLSNQVHETVIRRVDEGDKGKGLTRESDIKGVDGLLTSQKGVTLVTFFADCTPIMLYEPGIKAIASIHSGWRGTLKNIAAEAAGAMAKLPGFDPGRLIAAIGPSIRNCCFEVGDDVYSLFKEKYPDEDLYGRGADGKWHVDLQAIIRNALVQCGLREENIHDSGICTKCRKDLFFSYRGDCGKTGSHAAFMCLK